MFFELQYNTFTEYLELLKFFEKYSDVLGCFKNDGWILYTKITFVTRIYLMKEKCHLK